VNKKSYAFAILFWYVGFLFAQDSTSIQAIQDYKGWGWEAYRMQNNLITIAVVPAIGARVMQYDLGDHAFIYTNPDLFGRTFTPTQGSWPNFGGYKVWPAPQAKWPGTWPPPPVLDYGAYSAQITEDTQDSVGLYVESGVEKWVTPGVALSRKLTVYKNSTRVKVTQTITNTAAQAKQLSIWDVTQCNTTHPGEQDFENFWVYFPINPTSVFGAKGVKTSKASSAWKGEVAPDVYGVQFTPDDSKIFADPPERWVCYVDERDSMAYAKTFPIFEEEEYTDGGARVEVWNNSNPFYFEVEVLSPLVDLDANGGQYTFTEEWWAAKAHGPIRGVNRVGAIVTRLALTSDTHELSGEYGIFHRGTAQIVFLNESNSVLTEGEVHQVTPLKMFSFQEIVTIPENAKRVGVRIMDAANNPIGMVDAEELSLLSDISKEKSEEPRNFTLSQNYPNPFNPITKIEYSLKNEARVQLWVCDARGNYVAMLVDNRKAPGVHHTIWDGRNYDGTSAPSGVYLYRIEVDGSARVGKMLLLR
jgi:hypothetical protein